MANPDVPFIKVLQVVIPDALYSVYCLAYVTLKERFNN
jgi:hypothetical protein